ncbi:MAG TPA: hypothetical protein VF712_01755 [Thermoleophilaceae bacterium]
MTAELAQAVPPSRPAGRTASAVLLWHAEAQAGRRAGAFDPDSWCARFPDAAVLADYHRRGKQFVPPATLDLLDRVQPDLPPAGAGDAATVLAAFFDMALDKRRGRFDYHSYIGTELVGRGRTGDPRGFEHVLERQTSAVLLYLADLLGFEARTFLGEEVRFGERVPRPALVARRLRHTLEAMSHFGAELPPTLGAGVRACLARHRIDAQTLRALSDFAAERRAATDARSRRLCDLTMLPVSAVHDEYVFLRVLQLFEMVFEILVTGMRSCVDHAAGAPDRIPAFMLQMADLLRRSIGFFRILHTMPSENFAAFRVHTEGASAIQSERFKYFELLTAHPPRARVDSPAYTSVPRLATRYRDGLRNLEDALRGREISDSSRAAMTALDREYARWKRIHYATALKMIGDRSGTGGTPGIPYLAAAVDARLFPFLDASGARS